MKKLVALTGSGISAESGLKTFRESGGLWEGFNVMEVATPEGWAENPEMVLDFYNQRRRQAKTAVPNEGHKILAELEKYFDVSIITQNVDNLHEKAGSTHVIHLHGELFKARSTADETLIYDVEGKDIHMGDLCDKGSQLRPHIVWFGEMVPMMETAVMETREADIFLVVGTSLVVYPAAGLLDYVGNEIPKFIVDPNMPDVYPRPNLYLIEDKASKGMIEVRDKLLKDFI